MGVGGGVGGGEGGGGGGGGGVGRGGDGGGPISLMASNKSAILSPNRGSKKSSCSCHSAKTHVRN